MNQATYSPEDNKLRLYVGRVPRDEYLKLRADGWTALHKQREAGGGDFVATWTPDRRDTALEYGEGVILDEDMGPAERAADRAERFGGYRDKRTTEAGGHADRYDSQPLAHGFQDSKKAERAVSRHEKIAVRAVDAWSKAEYWTQRTAGVIGHALYVSRPAVRMGRIKTIEAEQRKNAKEREEIAERFRAWQKIAAMTDADKQTALAERFSGIEYGFQNYKHPTTGREGSLWDFLREDAADRITGAQAAALYLATHTDPASPEWEETRAAQWANHYALRLAYENQMIEAQGGRAAFLEMAVGGWIGKHQIRKVNKSPATGRVVSVTLKIKGDRWGNSQEGHHMRAFNIERLDVSAYRAPSDEDKAALQDVKKAEKAAAPKKAPCPLINPTDAAAERLQAIWNERSRTAYAGHLRKEYSASIAEKCLADWRPSTVCRITQAVYSANSKGSYARAGTKKLCSNATIDPGQYFHSYERQAREARERGPAICQLRTTSGDGNITNAADRVIIITDKPQKPFPAAVWEKYVAPAANNTGPSDTIKCSSCEQTSPRARWEFSTGHLIFGAAMTCPRCQMMHPSTNEAETEAVCA